MADLLPNERLAATGPHSRGKKSPSDASIVALENQGRRETGCASRTRGSHTKKERRRYARTTALPAQWFTAYTRSPRSPGLLASVACRFTPADLIPASGNQDHAISLVRRRVARLATRVRPSLPASRVVTIAIRPSCLRRDARIQSYIYENRKLNIFHEVA